MTRVTKQGVLVIENTSDQKCEECGKIDECRPYGENGAMICFECGQKNPERTLANFNELIMSKVKPINPNMQ